MSVESVKNTIAKTVANIDKTEARLRQVVVELAKDFSEELKEEQSTLRSRRDILYRAKRQLDLDLQAAQNKVKTDRIRARADYAAERLADAEVMLHSVAIEYLALCELSGRKQNGINLQNVKYGGRLAEVEAEL